MAKTGNDAYSSAVIRNNNLIQNYDFEFAQFASEISSW